MTHTTIWISIGTANVDGATSNVAPQSWPSFDAFGQWLIAAKTTRKNEAFFSPGLQPSDPPPGAATNRAKETAYHGAVVALDFDGPGKRGEPDASVGAYLQALRDAGRAYVALTSWSHPKCEAGRNRFRIVFPLAEPAADHHGYSEHLAWLVAEARAHGLTPDPSPCSINSCFFYGRGDSARHWGECRPGAPVPAAARIVAEPQPAAEWTTEAEPEYSYLTDDEIVAKGTRRKYPEEAFGTAASFEDLWHHDVGRLEVAHPSEHGIDYSEADYRFAGKLLRYTGRDCSRALELMRASPYGEARRGDEKWERTGYVETTILKALANSAGVYTRPGDTAPKSEPDERPSRWVCADDVAERDVTWMWAPRIPAGELCLVEGPSGSGKSSLLRRLVACVTRGDPLPHEVAFPREPANVVWISSEESTHKIRKRLRIAGADTKRVTLLADGETWSTREYEELRALVVEKDVRLIVLDALKDAMAGDTDKEDDTRRALRPLVEIAHEHGVTVLGIRHWRKGIGAASDRGAGSQAFRAVARASIVVAQHEGAIAIAQDKNSEHDVNAIPALKAEIVSESGEPVLHVRGTWPGLRADDLSMAVAQSAEEHGELQEACEELRVHFEGAGGAALPAGEIKAWARAIGIREKMLRRAAKRIGVQPRMERDEKGRATGWAWYLPPEPSGESGQSGHLVCNAHPVQNADPIQMPPDAGIPKRPASGQIGTASGAALPNPQNGGR